MTPEVNIPIEQVQPGDTLVRFHSGSVWRLVNPPAQIVARDRLVPTGLITLYPAAAITVGDQTMERVVAPAGRQVVVLRGGWPGKASGDTTETLETPGRHQGPPAGPEANGSQTGPFGYAAGDRVRVISAAPLATVTEVHPTMPKVRICDDGDRSGWIGIDEIAPYNERKTETMTEPEPQQPAAPKPPKMSTPMAKVLGVLAQAPASAGPISLADIQHGAGLTHKPDHMTMSALTARGWVTGSRGGGYEATEEGRDAWAQQGTPAG